MESHMELRAAASADLQSVTVELWQDGKPLGHILLDPSSAEQFAHNLARQRSILPDEVPREIDPGSRLEAVIDPAWRTRVAPYGRGIALALRHPGLGWLSFLFPPAEAQALGRWLMDLSQPPATD
jgi:hypothetical protein